MYVPAPEVPPLYLIVSANARYLAEAAASSGYPVVVVAGFADADLRALGSVRAVRRVPLTPHGLDRDAVLASCRDLHAHYTFSGVVVGAGAEGVVTELDRMFGCIGNRPQTFAACADRKHQHQTFAALGIPHAAVSRQPSGCGLSAGPRLLKRSGTSGGSHVTHYSGSGAVADATQVTEAYLPGTLVSHLFLADGVQSVTEGINTLWSSQHDPAHPFCSGGAINRSVLDAAQRQQVEIYAQRLTRHWRLCGLNCVDYSFSAGQLTALELNPRPSATMQLYLSADLFVAHVAASHGCLRRHTPAFSKPCAYAIVYARRCMRAVAAMFRHRPGHLTEFCDVPLPGTLIHAGAPVCSLRTRAHAAHVSVAAVIGTLQDALRNFARTLSAAAS